MYIIKLDFSATKLAEVMGTSVMPTNMLQNQFPLNVFEESGVRIAVRFATVTTFILTGEICFAL